MARDIYIGDLQGCWKPFRRLLDRVVRQAFSQRRKTLRNTLKGLVDADALAAAGIEPGRRAETLSLAEFDAIAAITAGSQAESNTPSRAG